MELRRYIGRRLVQIVIIFFVILTVLFLLFRLAPGDPVSRMIDPNLTPEDAALLIKEFGLDQPLWMQYLYVAFDLVCFSFGKDQSLTLSPLRLAEVGQSFGIKD